MAHEECGFMYICACSNRRKTDTSRLRISSPLGHWSKILNSLVSRIIQTCQILVEVYANDYPLLGS